MSDVRALWALVAKLSLANLTAIGLHWSRWRDQDGSIVYLEIERPALR